MIAFLIEFSLLFGFFGLINILIVRFLGNYDFRRKYLVISTLLSIAIPFIPSFPAPSILVFSEVLPAIEIFADGVQQATANIPEKTIGPFGILLIIYLIGAIILFSKLIIASFKISQIISGRQLIKENKPRIIYATAVKNPCSFFKTILLPKGKIFSDEELEAIVKHESLHIENNHSIEKMFFALIKIIFWWHPISWHYLDDIDLIHELQVDEQMESFMNPKKYKEILLQLVINPPRLRLTHSFSTNIKKRIQTMNQKKKKFNTIQLFSLCAILFVATVFIHSCAEANEESANISDVKISADNSDVSFYELNVVDTLTTFDYDTYKETVEFIESTLTIYRKPENMPVFPGCDDVSDRDELNDCSSNNLLKFIYKNIIYPKEAKDQGIEGMVLVKFVVNENGIIERRSFAQTLGYGIEETVNDMLDKMQNEIKWIPGNVDGKNVNVEYVLPVKFKLEDK